MRIYQFAIVSLALLVAFMAADIYQEGQCIAAKGRACPDGQCTPCRLPTDALRDVVVWIYKATYTLGSQLAYYLSLYWMRPVFRFLYRFYHAFDALVPGWPPIVGDFLRGLTTTRYGPTALVMLPVLAVALVVWQQERVRHWFTTEDDSKKGIVVGIGVISAVLIRLCI